MGLDFKKNEKLNKIITVILIGILILIILIPTKNSNTDITNTNSNSTVDDGVSKAYESYAEYYENKLKSILENSYGEGTMQVMVNLAGEEQSTGIYGSSDSEVTVEGVLIVAAVDSEQAVSDITFAVCALFNLPAHKVAVMIKK